MSVENLNLTEWQNEDNWLTPRILGIYASRRDSRLLVPKRPPGFGWTVNFGHKYGPSLVFGTVALAAMMALAGWYFAAHKD
jgi:uncharacterized membrane protein